MNDDDVRGVLVDGYTVIRRIGVGGFASVFEATQDDIGAPVALKILTAGIGEAQAQRRLEREYRSMGRLRDLRGIVPVYGAASTAEGLPVIVMAYMSGGSLLDRITARGPLPADEVLHITEVICDALGAAHAVGIHHRDIKPENVLLDRYDEPALSDFGLATIEGMRDASQTAASLSPPHAPPEKFLGDGVRDPVAADIYSLASTLHQLLTGRPPFGTSRDGGIASLILRITGDEPAAIDRPDVPAGLADAIRQGLAKDPAERPTSATAFRELALATPPTVDAAPSPSAPVHTEPENVPAEATRAVAPAAVHEPTRIVDVQPTTTVIPRRSYRRRWAFAALAFAAIAGVLAFGLTRPDADQSLKSDGKTVMFRGYSYDYILSKCRGSACLRPGDVGPQVATSSDGVTSWPNLGGTGCWRLFAYSKASGLYTTPVFNVVCL